MGRAEHKDPARQDRHFLTGLRIATDALALLADREAAERRQLHHLATYQGLGNLVQNRLDQFGGLVARKTDLLIDGRSEEHTSELQSLMRISYAVFCLKKNKKQSKYNTTTQTHHIVHVQHNNPNKKHSNTQTPTNKPITWNT